MIQLADEMIGTKDDSSKRLGCTAEPKIASTSGNINRPDPDVLWRRLDDEVILMQLKTDRMFSLNRTGARFWELIVEGMPLGKISERLLHEFKVAPERLALEIDQLLKLLFAEQLLVREER